jgi:acetoin utilization deacetylase AcuC-like enzyme
VDVIYLSHPVFALHDTGSWHPERPARLEAAARGVAGSALNVRRVDAPEIERSLLHLVHRPEYVDAIERFCRSGGGSLDPDTVAVLDSWEAALRAAGAGPEAVRLLEQSPDASAFLAVRPPGHHALVNRAMGFCLFNNAAITAAVLRERGQRVAIVDWDVHHGNGTQDSFDSDPDILYISVHQYPFYPGGGAVDETGTGPGQGRIVNVPVPAGTGGDVYRHLFERLIGPVLSQFAPDWILVSAGYDAHEEDPLAELRLLAWDYGFMASRLTAHVPANRIITFLEGGYHLPAITTSVAATLRGLAGVAEDRDPRRSPMASWDAVEQAVVVASRAWDVA